MKLVGIDKNEMCLFGGDMATIDEDARAWGDESTCKLIRRHPTLYGAIIVILQDSQMETTIYEKHLTRKVN